MTAERKKILLLKNLKIHNANALSSPYTVGFPAVTAWLGAVHNIQRYLNVEHKDLKFVAVGIVCHDINLHVHRGITPKGYNHDFYSILSTANPLKSDGTRPAIIPDIRCHLNVSLVIEYKGSFLGDKEKINNILYRIKFAGGDLLATPKDNIKFHTIRYNDEYEKDLSALKKDIRIGWWLIDRSDLIRKYLKENEGKDALDALLDHLKIHHECEKNIKADKQQNITNQETEGETNKKITWMSTKKELGWLVPIAVGFNGLNDLGKVRNQRDLNYQHRFAESIITLGEFKMILTESDIKNMLWQTSYDEKLKQYLCKQNNN